VPKMSQTEGKPYAEIGTLLRNLRLRRGMSQFDLASAVGINNSYLSRIENGERRPSPKILKKFSESLQYPYDELVVTSGILSEDFVRATPSTVHNTSNGDNTADMLRQLLNQMQGGRPQQQQSNGFTSSRRELPVFDTIPAGLLKESNVIEPYGDVEKLVLNESEAAFDPNAFALIVKGDSMVDAGILDGDTLIVSPATQAASGDVAVVRINRSNTGVKKVFIEPGRIILQAMNSNYKPLVFSYPDEVEILGKVILVRRKL
jgi:SOS-response transcriptional repressor LexA